MYAQELLVNCFSFFFVYKKCVKMSSPFFFPGIFAVVFCNGILQQIDYNYTVGAGNLGSYCNCIHTAHGV